VVDPLKFPSTMTVSQKVEKVCHFECQREIFLLNQLVLLRFLPLVEMTIGQLLLVPMRRMGTHSGLRRRQL